MSYSRATEHRLEPLDSSNIKERIQHVQRVSRAPRETDGEQRKGLSRFFRMAFMGSSAFTPGALTRRMNLMLSRARSRELQMFPHGRWFVVGGLCNSLDLEFLFQALEEPSSLRLSVPTQFHNDALCGWILFDTREGSQIDGLVWFRQREDAEKWLRTIQEIASV